MTEGIVLPMVNGQQITRLSALRKGYHLPDLVDSYIPQGHRFQNRVVQLKDGDEMEVDDWDGDASGEVPILRWMINSIVKINVR